MKSKLRLALALCLALGIVPAQGIVASETATAAVQTRDFTAGFAPKTLTLTPGTDNSELGITWYSDASEGTATVKFGDQTVEAESGDATTGNVWHKATVTGLTPDTEYTYSVSNDGENFSVEYEFKTSAEGEFTFVSVGDPQLTNGYQDAQSLLFSSDRTTAQGWQDAAAAMLEKVPNVSFIAGVGDQVDQTNVTDESMKTSEMEYGNFFAPDALRSIPFAPAVGNHDRHLGFTYHYNLPNAFDFSAEKLQGADYNNETNDNYATVESSGNYYYSYNNALFVVLNTSSYPASPEAAQALVDRYNAVITEAKAAYPDHEWLFVQHHKSTASVAQHVADTDIGYYVEAGFERVMDEQDVDFVLAGHDHVYARSFPMVHNTETGLTQRGDNQGGSTIVNPNGTIYVTMTTASGLKYYELFNENLYVKDNMAYPFLVNGAQGSEAYMETVLPLSTAFHLQAYKPEFTSITVGDTSVTFETYDIDNLDTPIDAFTVTKNID